MSVQELKKGVASTQERQKAVLEEWTQSKNVISQLKVYNLNYMYNYLQI